MGASNELLRVSGQWKASTPRILRVEAGLNLPLRTWTWHEGPHQRVELQADTPPCSSTHATPLGSGRQARYPISVLSQPDRALVLEAGLAEPGTFITVADAARDWWGLQTDFALDARTTRFPGRAAFAFTLRTQSHGGPNAFRQAWQELQTRPGDAVVCAGRTRRIAHGRGEPGRHRMAADFFCATKERPARRSPSPST
jgi:hypothetical protein